MSDTILEPKYYNLIFRTSCLTGVSSCYAIYKGQYAVGLGIMCVFLTSIHYWKYPDYSYRRYLDMAVTKTTVLYQFYTAINAQYRYPYLYLWGIGILAYIYGIYQFSKKDYWKSTYCHMTLHIFGNAACIVLYSGYIGNELV